MEYTCSSQGFQPLYDRILVKRIEPSQTTKGGIIIPDTAQEKAQYGEVVAIGEGKVQSDGTVRTLRVKIGEKVLFGKFSGTEVKLSGQDFLVIKEDEILGICK